MNFSSALKSLIFGLALIATSVQAGLQPVTYAFSGVVFGYSNEQNGVNHFNQAYLGTTLSGTLTFRPDQADSDPYRDCTVQPSKRLCHGGMTTPYMLESEINWAGGKFVSTIDVAGYSYITADLYEQSVRFWSYIREGIYDYPPNSSIPMPVWILTEEKSFNLSIEGDPIFGKVLPDIDIYNAPRIPVSGGPWSALGSFSQTDWLTDSYSAPNDYTREAVQFRLTAISVVQSQLQAIPEPKSLLLVGLALTVLLLSGRRKNTT